MTTDSSRIGMPGTESANRFEPGTFARPSAPAPVARMLLAQTRMELSLFLRNGEQLLVALVIPIAILIGLTLLDVGAIPAPRIDHAISAVLTIALMGTAFTGQAIAVGFDRRYGALKRLGGTPLPPSVVIGGKTAAVLVLVLGQSVVLGGIAALMGWRPMLAGVLMAVPQLVLGTLCFCALGLLLGGTLKAELVLALANLIWFLLMGAAGLAIGFATLPQWLADVLVVIPSHALTTGISEALAGGVPWLESVVVAVWAAVGAVLAVRWFSFT